MASVTEIIDSEAGPYEWGVRDCLTTASALVEGLGGGAQIDYSLWRGMSEEKALAKAKKKFGGVAEALAVEFASWKNIEILGGDHRLLPGDIVQLHGTAMGWGETFDTAKTGDLIGFVDESFTILHWYSQGLRPVDGYQNIVRVFRCRR